jgi:deoxyadenosine/deoxycytidine kinase
VKQASAASSFSAWQEGQNMGRLDDYNAPRRPGQPGSCRARARPPEIAAGRRAELTWAPHGAGGAQLMRFQYIALEGPIGVGKTSVVERLAQRLEAGTLLEEWGQNPFLQPFYDSKPGAAFQVELFYLLSRYRQQQELLQRHLFQQLTISDYLFEKSKLFAYLNLEDSELLIYEKLWSLLVEGVPRPDLVVYLQAPTEVLMRRIRQRGRPEEARLSEEYLAEVNRAYNHYFFHYTQTPLLVVNTSEVDFVKRPEDVEDLIKQVRGMGRGTQYYVPMGGKG